MGITIKLDVMLAHRKMKSKDLAKKLGISVQSLSMLKTGKALGIRFNTLEKICDILDCTPQDIIHYERNPGSQNEVE